MTRIAILIPSLFTGGTEVATLETSRAFKDMGHVVEVLVYFDEVDSVMRKTFEEAGVVVLYLGLKRHAGFSGLVLLMLRLGKVLWKGRHDLIWVQYMTPTLLPLLVARPFTKSLIAAVHVAAHHYDSGALSRLRWLARWWCDRFVCVSQTSAEGIFGGTLTKTEHQGQVLIIPNAIDIPAAKEAAPRDWHEQFRLPANAQVIGYVGRLAHNKGVDVLLRAAALLSGTHPQLHWVIVGEGEERQNLESFADELGVSHILHFVGNIAHDEVFGAMKGFDVAIVPSREEGFGLSAVEAMACGTPVIASRIDALKEVIIDGETGLLISSDDSVALAEALKELLISPEQRDILAAAAIRHAEANYSRRAFLERLRTVVDRVEVNVGADE